MKKQKQPRTYRRDVAAAVHEMMSGGHAAGLIDRETMAEFDASCLAPPVPARLDETQKTGNGFGQ